MGSISKVTEANEASKKTLQNFSKIMKKELEELMTLRFRIKELKKVQYEKKSDELDFLTSVKGVLKILAEAKAIYEVNNKLLALRDDVAKAFGFYTTCQEMIKTSDVSIRDALEISVKGAGNALKKRLTDFIEQFPKEKIIQIKDLIMDVKIPTEKERQNVNKIFKDDDILFRIESMMKELGDDEASKIEANVVAEKESAHALATLSGSLVCISSFVAPNNSLEDQSEPNQCIPEINNILNNAIQTLKHEKSVKESLIDVKSKGKENTKSLFAVQNANLQDILHQIDVDLGDLLKLYSVNLNLSKQLESADCNLDVTNLDERLNKTQETDKTGKSMKTGNDLEPEKNCNTPEPEKLANTPGESDDDGLSDVDENVSMWCENDTKSPNGRHCIK